MSINATTICFFLFIVTNFIVIKIPLMFISLYVYVYVYM